MSDTLSPEIQQAICEQADCLVSVLYQPLPSGHGFKIIEAHRTPEDALFTGGSNNRPECPYGHGELTLADDPQAGAEPLQVSLPGIVPPFNYEGAYLELEAMAVECDRLHREYELEATAAKDAKKRWDRAAETYTKAALELRRRRREKVEKGDPIEDLAPAVEQPKFPTAEQADDTTREMQPIGRSGKQAPATAADESDGHRYPKRGEKKPRPRASSSAPKAKAKKQDKPKRKARV